MVDLNALPPAEDPLEHVQLWSLDVVWPAHTPAERADALARLDEVLTSRRLVAAVQGAMPVPLGLRASLVLAVQRDRALLHDGAGALEGSMDPEVVIAALQRHAGAWVIETDDDGFFAHDHVASGFDAAVGRFATGEAGEGDPLSPAARLTVHLGEVAPISWGVALKQSGGAIRLHGDVAVIEGEPFAVDWVLQEASDKGPALTIANLGDWCLFRYYSAERMSAKIRWRDEREPTLAGSAGLGALAFPRLAGGGYSGGESPAHRLASAMVDAVFLPAADEVALLARTMGQEAAEAVVAGLRRCTPATRFAAAPPEWVDELCQVLDLLGFDPQWARVVLGAAPEPDGSTEVRGTGILAGSVAAAKAEWRAENQASLERQRDATGASRLIWARSWKPRTRYVFAAIELCVAVALVLLQPLPFAWLNTVVGALCAVDAVWQVADTRRLARHEGKQGPSAQG